METLTQNKCWIVLGELFGISEQLEQRRYKP